MSPTPTPHPAQVEPDLLVKECEFRRQRRSGPGGQHRNKVETGVFIQHRPTGVSAEATEGRSQHRNRETAIFRLRVTLAVEIRSEPDSEPSQLWRSRCRKGRIQVNPTHADFPALLAEALDHAAQCQWDVKAAAARLGCSTTQLVKLLKVDPRGLGWLNQQRKLEGMHELR